MKKKKNNLIKISGGLTVMLSVFLFLSLIVQVNKNKELYAQLIRNNLQQDIPLNTFPKNVIRGSFNLDSHDNIIIEEQEDASKFYYKALNSERLKKLDLNPVLKLEINKDDKKQWKQIEWSWLDSNQGSLFFHYSTEINSTIETTANFTGKYQIILE